LRRIAFRVRRITQMVKRDGLVDKLV